MKNLDHQEREREREVGMDPEMEWKTGKSGLLPRGSAAEH